MEKFRPIKIDSIQTVIAMNASTRSTYKTLLDHARTFVEDLCGVDRNSPVFSLNYVLEQGKFFSLIVQLEHSIRRKHHMPLFSGLLLTH